MSQHQEEDCKTEFGGKLIPGHLRSTIIGIVANALISTRHPKLTIKLVTASRVTKYSAQEVVTATSPGGKGIKVPKTMFRTSSNPTDPRWHAGKAGPG